MSRKIDINVLITDPDLDIDNDEMDGDIDLQLHHIRDETGGRADIKQLENGLRAVIIKFLNQYGDVDEF